METTTGYSAITLIHDGLGRIRSERVVRTLCAIESGSRAWGFASRDSDFDIRFVYLSGIDDYLAVFPKRDVIENHELSWVRGCGAPLDFAGWDLKKFLALISKSNPVAFEWLQSPIVYHEALSFRAVRETAKPFYSPRATMHHYLSMARHNYHEHMRDGQAPSVRLKKYLYITRPLLCCRWIERNVAGGPPPMAFTDVLRESDVGADVSDALGALVDLKRKGFELEEGAAIPDVNRFIDAELLRLRSVADTMPNGSGKPSDLDDLFYHLVR